MAKIYYEVLILLCAFKGSLPYKKTINNIVSSTPIYNYYASKHSVKYFSITNLNINRNVNIGKSTKCNHQL